MGLTMKIISERLVPVATVVKLLEEESRKRSLSSVETITLEYCRRFAKVPPESVNHLMQKLTEIELPLEIAVQLINVAPRTEGELRTLLAPLSKVFTTEELRSIISLIKSYASRG